jgi:hypothetical protein
MPDPTLLVTTQNKNRFAVVHLHYVARAGRINGFSKSHHLVFLTILSHMNRQKGYAWPSYSRIGEIICRSPETVRRAVRDLNKWGFIKREERKGTANRYYQAHQTIGESDYLEG